MRLLGGRTPAAKVAKVSPQTVGNWTGGRSTPDKQYLRRLREGVRRQAAQADNARAAPPSTPAPTSLLADEAEPARPRGLYALPSPGGSSSGTGGAAAPQPEPARPRASVPPTPSGADLPKWLRKRQEALAKIRPLTQAEAGKLRDSFRKSLKKAWEYADEGITATNRRRADAHIWRSIDDEETEILADYIMERALVDPVVAQAVRGISAIWDMYAVGLILLPRFWDTYKFYATHGGFSL